MRQKTVDAFTSRERAGQPLLDRLPSDPDIHYDRVTNAWRYLIGEDLHVGYFEDGKDDLFEATEALTHLMADSAQLAPGHQVLDIGCGTGNPAIYLAARRGCRVVGVSTSRVGIEKANAKSVASAIAERAIFRVADGTATGCPNNTFDCVWIMESSHLMPQKDQLLKEAGRVLRPDGSVVLCDFILRKELPQPPSFALGHDLKILEEVYGKTTLAFLEFYAQQLTEAGMEAETRDISDQVLPTFEHWRHNAERHRGQVAELLDAGHVDRFIRSCEILVRLFESHQLGYGIVKARKSGR
jgi:27-O-demethylrifamycin SV methyltransferase